MERYTEITIPELLDYISKKQIKSIYFESKTKEICPLNRYNITIDKVHDIKWFKLEVIE